MNIRKRKLTTWSGAALICFIALTPSANAQQVVAPLSTTPAIAEQQASSTNPTGATSSGVSTPTTSNQELRWGPINFRPHVSYRYLYGNGIQASPGNSKKTEVQSFSPGLFAELGTHWTLDYTPTWTYYSSSAFRDTVDQSGQINWATKYQEWTLSAGQNYSRTDSPLAETGRQTQQTNHTSNFNALVALNSRYALETALTQSLRFAESYADTRTWSIREMLHRQASSRLDTAIGTEYSYTAIDRTPDIATLQFLGNMTWRPNTQLNLSLQAGLENRRIYNQAASTKQNPVYSASLQYTPFESTQLGITAARSTSASFFDSQLTESTRYGLTLNQRLLGRLQFTAALNHEESAFTATRTSATTDRTDKIDSVNLGLNTTFLTRIRTGVTYQYSRNSSNVEGFGFSSRQIGLEISYSF